MTIRAPLSGVVLERAVTLGTVVNPADNLILLSDLASLWVVGEVPEREASLVSVGQSADIEVAAFPGERFEAEVFHIGERLDPALRTASVRCLLQNPDRRLRPEMYAANHIELGKTPPILVVPEHAIQIFDGEGSRPRGARRRLSNR